MLMVESMREETKEGVCNSEIITNSHIGIQ